MKATCCGSGNMNKILYFLLHAKGRICHRECLTNILSCTLTGIGWPEHNLVQRGTSSWASTDVENVYMTWKLYLNYLHKFFARRRKGPMGARRVQDTRKSTTVQGGNWTSCSFTPSLTFCFSASVASSKLWSEFSWRSGWDDEHFWS